MTVLVTGAWNCTEIQLNRLRELGHTVLFQQHESAPLVCDPSSVDAVICNNLFITHPIEGFTSLRYIQLTSAGYDRVPLDYIRAKNIVIHNAAGVYSVPMAEFAIAGVLCLFKKMRSFWKQQEMQLWNKQRDLVELCGKKVCIVGCGNLGQECARLFRAFDCNVRGVNRSTGEKPFFDKIVSLTQLSEEVEGADITLCAIASTSETRHLFSSTVFNRVKAGSIFINLSRGNVVDTKALEKALRGSLGGAVLDVFEEEPLPKEHQLWSLPNVLISPHNSYVGDGNAARLEKLILDHFRRFGENDSLFHP